MSFLKQKNDLSNENKNTYTEIIQKLSALRIKAGYSMRDLSLILGQNSQFIKSIENQKVELKLRTLLDILLVLGVSLQDFFYKDKGEDESVLRLFDDLSAEGKELIFKLVKKLVNKNIA